MLIYGWVQVLWFFEISLKWSLIYSLQHYNSTLFNLRSSCLRKIEVIDVGAAPTAKKTAEKNFPHHRPLRNRWNALVDFAFSRLVFTVPGYFSRELFFTSRYTHRESLLPTVKWILISRYKSEFKVRNQFESEKLEILYLGCSLMFL